MRKKSSKPIVEENETDYIPDIKPVKMRVRASVRLAGWGQNNRIENDVAEELKWGEDREWAIRMYRR